MAIEMRENRMRRFTVLGVLPVEGFRQDTDEVTKHGSVGGSPNGVLYGKKRGSGREHDGGVVEEPGMIKRREVGAKNGCSFVENMRSLETPTGFGEDDGVCEEWV